jgi:hypothetical protein
MRSVAKWSGPTMCTPAAGGSAGSGRPAILTVVVSPETDSGRRFVTVTDSTPGSAATDFISSA